MLTVLESWLEPDGPVALSTTEVLESATGRDGIIFPPTYADPDRQKKTSSYVIDDTSDGRICLIDSVGSQANRIEPIFKRKDLASLVPQVTIEVGTRQLNLLDIGHRAADAVIRFSTAGKQLREAFLQYRDHSNAEPLAKIAPTSLIFGVWDSRGDADHSEGTGVKIPRIVESTIRAYGVEVLHRSATYVAALTSEEQQQYGVSGNSEEGFANALASGPGGVIAKSGIKREALLNLVALRAIGAGDDDVATKRLQHYVLGLALVAFVAPSHMYLRQGCLLTASETQPAVTHLVWRTGKRELIQLSEDDTLHFARAGAEKFGVGPNVLAKFQGKPNKKSEEKGVGKKTKAAEA